VLDFGIKPFLCLFPSVNPDLLTANGLGFTGENRKVSVEL
jgi:hypothetical protein